MGIRKECYLYRKQIYLQKIGGLASSNRQIVRTRSRRFATRSRGFTIRALDVQVLDVNYMHQNLLKEKVVSNVKEYYFSSARNYADLEYEIEVAVLFME